MILQINKMYSPDIGGVETVVREYSEYLNRHEDVVVLCSHKQFSLKTTVERINGVKVYRCASFGVIMSMPISVVFFFYLFSLGRKARVVHFHEPFPLGSIGSFLVSKKRTVFVTWHSDIIKQKKVKFFFELFQKRLCKKATSVISTSDRLIEFSSVLTAFKDKVITIPLSIDKDEYLNAKLNHVSIEGLPREYVLFLGRFSYYKGLFVLLDAIESIEESIPFVIAGTGELSEAVKIRVSKSKKNILLVDRFVTDDEKKYLLQKSKFMVFPSIYPSEAFGIVQLESMVYGKPVINTYLPTGVPWVSLDKKTGLTTSVKNHTHLAKAIKELYYNDEMIEKFGREATKRVDELFSDSVTNKQMHELYFENK